MHPMLQLEQLCHGVHLARMKIKVAEARAAMTPTACKDEAEQQQKYEKYVLMREMMARMVADHAESMKWLQELINLDAAVHAVPVQEAVCHDFYPGEYDASSPQEVPPPDQVQPVHAAPLEGQSEGPSLFQ